MKKCVWQLFVNKVFFAERWKIDSMKKIKYVILAACVVVVLAVACSGKDNLRSKIKGETEVIIETEQTEMQEMIETTAEVKSTEIISIVTKKRSYDTTDGHLLNYQIYEHDNRGNVIKENWFSGDGELVDVYDYSYTYDSKGNVSKMTLFLEDGSVLYWYEYEYDSEGKRTQEIQFYDVGLTSGYVTKYIYDSDGNLIEKLWERTDGSAAWWDDYAYDSEGKRISGVRVGGDDSISEWYEYEYDAEGNMTKEIFFAENGQPWEVTEYSVMEVPIQ